MNVDVVRLHFREEDSRFSSSFLRRQTPTLKKRRTEGAKKIEEHLRSSEKRTIDSLVITIGRLRRCVYSMYNYSNLASSKPLTAAIRLSDCTPYFIFNATQFTKSNAIIPAIHLENCNQSSTVFNAPSEKKPVTLNAFLTLFCIGVNTFTFLTTFDSPFVTSLVSLAKY